jgi:hypothetical protein
MQCNSQKKNEKKTNSDRHKLMFEQGRTVLKIGGNYSLYVRVDRFCFSGVCSVMVKNSGNCNKTDKQLSPQIIDHNTDHDIGRWKSSYWLGKNTPERGYIG